MNRTPRLRTVLLVVNLVILALPLAGIAVLRIYESALVRQTESELIAQGAFVAAAYKAALARALAAGPQPPANMELNDYGVPMAPQWAQQQQRPAQWRPRPAKLDLAIDQIRPRPPEPAAASITPDPLAAQAGHEVMAVMREAQVITLAAIRVVDYNGTIVASTNQEVNRTLADQEEVARALAGENVSLLRDRVSDEATPPLRSISRGTHVRIFVAMPIVHHTRVLGAVVLSRTPANIGQALYHKRYLLLYGALVLLGAVLLVTLYTSLTLSRPVKALIRQTERAVRGEKGAVAALERPGTREIAQLSQAVAHMARTLEQRAEYIRDFAAHVSHEFKTPLTAIRGAIELLNEHSAEMSEAERGRFMQNLAGDAERLQRLVQRLLDLARADVIQVGRDTADVARVLERVAERYRGHGMTINVEHNARSATVAMAEETLESIISNLLDNSRQHAGGHACVTIRVHNTGPDGSELIIVIADNGPGVSQANTGKIFQPFFTTARKQGGTGLGLAVVQSLLNAHRGSIRLLPSASGAAFELRLPLKRTTAPS